MLIIRLSYIIELLDSKAEKTALIEIPMMIRSQVPGLNFLKNKLKKDNRN